MHELDRASATEPACLAGYDYRRQTWEDVGTDKQNIRSCLAQMQDDRCAYCEGPLYAGGHIEHFRRKRHFPSLTFVWSNLFLSCDGRDGNEHCGHYKDRPRGDPYDPNDLVKPDEDNPDCFFYFHSSGEVRSRSGASPNDSHRASETIRVFNLNCGALMAARRRELRIYMKREPDILESLMALDPKERQEYIDLEIQATRTQPYWAVIRHYFAKCY